MVQAHGVRAVRGRRLAPAVGWPEIVRLEPSDVAEWGDSVLSDSSALARYSPHTSLKSRIQFPPSTFRRSSSR